ncbi:MAG: anaerobic ribonucleoside-triphosphate reductase activating protein [Treponema sp.]|nr:anaerobic ribonucleoside-triphosphate reductase activating protein [Treponema sp.]
MIDPDEPLGSLLSPSLVDYPGHVACVLFLPGCNLFCPYCYNKGLVIPPFDKEKFISFNQLLSHLNKRKNVIQHLVITGGEALLNSNLKEIIIQTKKIGLKIKLDTNGQLPQKLKEIINNPETKPDYLALDVKTTPKNYSALKGSSQKIIETLNILKSLPSENYEIRTVLVPPLVNKENISEIAEYLPENANWFFARFINENCINPEYSKILPYTENENREIVEAASKIIKNSFLR